VRREKQPPNQRHAAQ